MLQAASSCLILFLALFTGFWWFLQVYVVLEFILRQAAAFKENNVYFCCHQIRVSVLQERENPIQTGLGSAGKLLAGKTTKSR